jgi:hypothetical protein
MRSLFVERGAFVLSFTYNAVLSCALRGWPERHYDPRRPAWLLPPTRDVVLADDKQILRTVIEGLVVDRAWAA